MKKLSWILFCLLFTFSTTACKVLVTQEAIENSDNGSLGEEDNNNVDEGEEEGSEDPSDDEEVPPVDDIAFKYIPMDWDGKHVDAADWSDYTLDAIDLYGEALVNTRPSDILSFCPTYDQLNVVGKKMFWIYLISVMTRFESSFNPAAYYQEAFTDSSGQRVVSRGLLQLSIESALGYKCNLDNANDLHDPEKNLHCGIRIMSRWVERDGVISSNATGSWRGGARYWSVLRTYSTRDPITEVKSRTKLANVCKTTGIDEFYLVP